MPRPIKNAKKMLEKILNSISINNLFVVDI
jgi:hypothetical protein